VLAAVLQDGMTPADWYRLLNSFVFFWPTHARLEILLGTRAYRDRAHTVLTVGTERLLADHGGSTYLSPINSGATLFNARPRGRDTFQRIADYPFAEMRRRRGLAGAIAEVAVKHGAVPVASALVSVERRHGATIVEEIWSR